MPWRIDAEDDIVRGEVDFYHDVPVGHLLQEPVRSVLIHDVGTVADALGVAEIDGLADVEAETFGRDKAGREFSCVKRDVDLRIDAVEIVEHEHLPVVLGHGEIGVFGLDKVETDDTRVLGGNLEGEQRLSEDLLRREGAEDLVEEANLDRTGGAGAELAAVFDLVARVESIVQLFPVYGDFVSETGSEQGIAKAAEILAAGPGGVTGAVLRGVSRRAGPFEMSDDFAHIGEDGSLHDLEILLVLRGGASSDLVEPLSNVGFVDSVETIEGGEELVVAADACTGNEAAHGKGVDQGIIELLIVEDALGAHIAFAADRLRRKTPGGSGSSKKAVRAEIDAQAVLGSILKEGLGIDSTREVHVQVCPFWHASQEGAEFEWTLTGCLKSEGCALLRRSGMRRVIFRRCVCGSLGEERRDGEYSQDRRGSAQEATELESCLD
jgi:hypothetical protein